MTLHKAYFIGAGPGSADHLTLLGSRTLYERATVYSPSPFEITFIKYLAAFAPFCVHRIVSPGSYGRSPA